MDLVDVKLLQATDQLISQLTGN